ncbi:MAG: HEAT repeat domain-containing protein [Thermoanaerobaculia bacterium]|nr:HEAT repeat domain-containing protein [Thermoanaerobaculia bacterium]
MSPIPNTPSRRSVVPIRNLVLPALLLAVFASSSLARLDAEQAEVYYRQGQDALAEGRYGDAAEQFRALSRESEAQVDRAIYWQAYSEAKAGNKQAALSTLNRLTAEFPDSPWLDDARALRLDLGGVAAAKAVETSDEDLKLYALDALMQAEPDRAVRLLQEFLAGDHAPHLKQRALFVLGQTDSAKAAEILADLARNGEDVNLQRKAIQAMGVSDQPAAISELADIYRSSEDAGTKLAVLHSLLHADAAELTAELALAESDRDLQAEAIRMLGAMEAMPELERIAATLGSGQRQAVFHAYGIADHAEPLLRAVRTSKDLDEIEDAINALVMVGSDENILKTLLDVYHRTEERSVQEKVLNFLMIEDEATHLIEIFRTEKDAELKRQALQHLAVMDDPQVQSLIEELLRD